MRYKLTNTGEINAMKGFHYISGKLLLGIWWQGRHGAQRRRTDANAGGIRRFGMLPTD